MLVHVQRKNSSSLGEATNCINVLRGQSELMNVKAVVSIVTGELSWAFPIPIALLFKA